MRIAGLEKCSLIDYSGKIAAVVFTQGCNLNCSFCHNRQLIPRESSAPLLPTGHVLEALCERRGFLDAVVVSGGEPTIQEGLADFLAQVRSLGFVTKLDTNGTRPWVIEALLKQRLLDFIAMDLKSPLARYSAICREQVDLEAIKSSVQIIMQAGIEHQFRTTMIPQLGEQDLRQMVSDFTGIDCWLRQHLRLTDGCRNIGFGNATPEARLRRIARNQTARLIDRALTPWMFPTEDGMCPDGETATARAGALQMLEGRRLDPWQIRNMKRTYTEEMRLIASVLDKANLDWLAKMAAFRVEGSDHPGDRMEYGWEVRLAALRLLKPYLDFGNEMAIKTFCWACLDPGDLFFEPGGAEWQVKAGGEVSAFALEVVRHSKIPDRALERLRRNPEAEARTICFDIALLYRLQFAPAVEILETIANKHDDKFVRQAASDATCGIRNAGIISAVRKSRH